MSPRAGWRLETFGYPEVYDYVAGKSDWMAAGLPTEGNRAHPPRVAEVMDRSVPTGGPAELVADVMARVGSSGAQLCVVVNTGQVVQGRLRLERLDPADARPAEEAMEPGPATVRADADLAETTERMRGRGAASLIVSTPDGSCSALSTSNRTRSNRNDRGRRQGTGGDRPRGRLLLSDPEVVDGDVMADEGGESGSVSKGLPTAFAELYAEAGPLDGQPSTRSADSTRCRLGSSPSSPVSARPSSPGCWNGSTELAWSAGTTTSGSSESPA